MMASGLGDQYAIVGYQRRHQSLRIDVQKSGARDSQRRHPEFRSIASSTDSPFKASAMRTRAVAEEISFPYSFIPISYLSR